MSLVSATVLALAVTDKISFSPSLTAIMMTLTPRADTLRVTDRAHSEPC